MEELELGLAQPLNAADPKSGRLIVLLYGLMDVVVKKIKKIEVWECQDCGALYAKTCSCWCCINMDGNYTGKRKNGYEIIKIGAYTKEQLKSIT